LAFPSDLEVPCTDWEDMVLSMDSEVQRIISLAAVSRLDRASMRASAQGPAVLTRGATASFAYRHRELKDEILAGKSIVVVNSKGQPERIVSVVVAHLMREDGRFLAQLGKHESRGSSAACELPGLKRESSELVGDAWARLRTTKLGFVSGAIRVLRSERALSTRSSRQHRVTSRYLRHVLYCSAEGGFEAPSCTALSPFECREESQEGSGSNGAVRLPPHVLQRELGDLASREVFYFRYGSKGAFYAWLSQREFESLGGPSGERAASVWLAALGRPPGPP